MDRKTSGEVAHALVRLPHEFKSRQNVSIHALLIEKQLLESLQQISETEIVRALQEAPHCIEAWAEYSCDKRTGSGWFFREAGKDSWEVGCLKKGTIESITQFTNKFDACTVFIRKEISSIQSDT